MPWFIIGVVVPTAVLWTYNPHFAIISFVPVIFCLGKTALLCYRSEIYLF